MPQKGYIPTQEHRMRQAEARRGKKLSEETKRRMSEAQIRASQEGKHLDRLGKKLSEETKRKMSESQRKRWAPLKKDRTLLKKHDRRNDPLYKRWRTEVWMRDNFKCHIANNDCAGRIEAHHILGWTKHVELRYEVNNGITLCHVHHPRGRAKEEASIPRFQELVSSLEEKTCP